MNIDLSRANVGYVQFHTSSSKSLISNEFKMDQVLLQKEEQKTPCTQTCSFGFGIADRCSQSCETFTDG